MVLTVLALDVNRVVPVDRLVDAVWGDAPPSTARGQIQTCVSALRKLMGDAGFPDVIETRSPGYVLRFDPENIDTLRFSSLVTASRGLVEAGQIEGAAAALRDALSLWRGVALLDVPGDLVQRSAAIWEDRRLAAVEELARLELELGRHEELIHELSALVAEHPLRERLYYLLMSALHRAGRQAEALEVGRRARTVLVEEVGIEPGRELRDLAGSILRGDLVHDAPATAAATPPPPRPAAVTRHLHPAPGPRHDAPAPVPPAVGTTPTASAAPPQELGVSGATSPPVAPAVPLLSDRAASTEPSLRPPRSGPSPRCAPVATAPSPAARMFPVPPVGTVAFLPPAPLPQPTACAPNPSADDEPRTGQGAQARAEVVAVVPRQLPASIADFTGREDALEEIKGFLQGGHEGSAQRWSMPIVAISGKGGVGKSSLAVRVAHELSSRFPDGQLYADLRALAGEDSTARLLARFLRALGVAGSAVPEDVDERAELYRSKLSGKRVLLVLDDVVTEKQILPLLPGSPTCAVMVTCRTRLSGLPGAYCIDIGVFGAEKSLELLGKVVGRARVAADATAARELVAFCGGLPLALRIAGARLVARPHLGIDGLVRRLRNEAYRLDELVHHGWELRSNIELTYRTLGDRARQLFRLFALVQAPDFHHGTAAALLNTSSADGREELETLVDAQLLDIVEYPDSRTVRYRFHNLIRIYARECLVAEESEQEKSAAVERMLGSLLARAEQAHRAEYGGDFTIVHGDAARWWPPGGREGSGGETTGLGDVERQDLVAGVRQAAQEGMDELCWDLALTSVTLFETKGYFDDWRECTQVALEATERAGNRRGTAAMLYSMGTMHMFQTRLTEASRCFTSAFELFRGVGEAHGCALVLRNLAHVDGVRGDVLGMLDKYVRSLRTMRTVGDRIGEAHILRSLAKYRLDEGDTEQARGLLEQALAICREVRCLRAEAQVVHRFAEVYLATGQIDLARQSLHRVLRIVRDSGDRIGESYAVYGLGVLRVREGRLDAAETTLVHALSLSRQVGEQLIEAKALYALGEIALARDTASVGVPHLVAACDLFERLGSTLWQARARVMLARVEFTGDPAAAARHAAIAARLLESVDPVTSAPLLAELSAFGGPPLDDPRVPTGDVHGSAPA